MRLDEKYSGTFNDSQLSGRKSKSLGNRDTQKADSAFFHCAAIHTDVTLNVWTPAFYTALLT